MLDPTSSQAKLPSYKIVGKTTADELFAVTKTKLMEYRDLHRNVPYTVDSLMDEVRCQIIAEESRFEICEKFYLTRSPFDPTSHLVHLGLKNKIQWVVDIHELMADYELAHLANLSKLPSKPNISDTELADLLSMMKKNSGALPTDAEMYI